MINTHFLKKISLFSELHNDDVERVAEIASEKTHKKNEVIFHENDPGSVLFILKSGAVKISVCDRNGKEDILRIIYPGEYFGDMSHPGWQTQVCNSLRHGKKRVSYCSKRAFSLAYQ